MEMLAEIFGEGHATPPRVRPSSAGQIGKNPDNPKQAGHYLQPTCQIGTLQIEP
jgi:hypothetical protein